MFLILTLKNVDPRSGETDRIVVNVDSIARMSDYDAGGGTEIVFRSGSSSSLEEKSVKESLDEIIWVLRNASILVKRPFLLEEPEEPDEVEEDMKPPSPDDRYKSNREMLDPEPNMVPTYTLSHTPIVAGSVNLTISRLPDSKVELVADRPTTALFSHVWGDLVLAGTDKPGTINYLTGIVTLPVGKVYGQIGASYRYYEGGRKDKNEERD